MRHQGEPGTADRQASGSKSIRIEGWRGINHSFALVNQYQILQLMRLPGLRLFHRDLPFAFPHWNRSNNGAGLLSQDQRFIDALQTGPEDVDCVYRICTPFRAGTDSLRTLTFMVTEFGLSEGSFDAASRDMSFYTRGDNLIVAPSLWARDRVVDWGFPADRVKIVPHGVDAATFLPATAAERQANRVALGLGDDDIVFLNVGVPTWNKGLDILLLAFATLRSQGHRIRLVLKDQKNVYGLSVDGIVQELRRLHPGLAWTDVLGAMSVVSTNISREELRALYGIADCYVSPYRAEGFNLPVLEAIACGTPVVATRGGATDDFCDDAVALRIGGVQHRHQDLPGGVKGTYIEPDLSELIDAMAFFASRQSLDARRFADGRDRLLRRFSWESAARALAALGVGYDNAQAASARPHGSYEPSLFSAENGTAYQLKPRATGPLVDVARDASATQSSLSPWSQQGEAAQALSDHPNDFAFHTDKEDSPWWQADLGAVYPIEAVVVHNRRSGLHDRARTLRIEVAEQGGQWILVHGGFAHFGAEGFGHPFEAWTGSVLRARYVRISLAEHQYLHLTRVEVLVRVDQLAFETFVTRNHLFRFNPQSTDFGRPYALEKPDGARSSAIVGLKINYSSRFGNLCQQYTHAIQLALATGLRFIQLGRHDLFDFEQSFTAEGIMFLPPDEPLPQEGFFLIGSFFNSNPFTPVLGEFLRFEPQDEAAYSDIAQRFLRPYLLTGIPLPGETHFRDELTIHIRSGDLFEGGQTGNLWYRQPPLSFYTLIITRMRDAGRITRVRLVFEDRANPCIPRLEAWLDGAGVPHRTQCGTLHEDMSALIDAPHLAFGYGTFGYAACRLSTRIETLHFFAPELGGSYEHIPAIEAVFAVSDAKGDYMKAGKLGVSAGEWLNTPEQRDLMVTYPEDCLRVDTLRDGSARIVADSAKPPQSAA